MINTRLIKLCEELSFKMEEIPSVRRQTLNVIADFIFNQISQQLPVNLVYICTHNSRRSHFGQIWATLAASYFKISGVQTFSGGTEATAFHPNAIAALNNLGFEVQPMSDGPNAKYEVSMGSDLKSTCFSKVYNDEVNPQSNFVAIMTCSDAEQNCPFIPGVALRVATSYDDPKEFDGTELQDEKYVERCRQIGSECLFIFNEVSKKLNNNDLKSI